MAHLKPINKLSFKDMIVNFDLYPGLPDGLLQLPLPEYLKIGKRKLAIPQSLDDFTRNICYGQRLYLLKKEDNDFGSIIRNIGGYYYPLVTTKKWNEDNVLLFGRIILTLKVKYLYPLAMHLTSLIEQMIEKEQELLSHKSTKIEIAAGIEKLNIFSELTSLDFLSDAMKCTIDEVLLKPYKECLVRFMLAKERVDFQEKYFQLIQELNKSKNKYRESIIK